MNKELLKIVAVRYLLQFQDASKNISHNKELITYDASQWNMADSNYKTVLVHH